MPTWNFYKSRTPASQYLNILTLQKLPSVNGTDLLVRLENTLPGSEGGKPIAVKLDDIFGVEGDFNGYQVRSHYVIYAIYYVIKIMCYHYLPVP